MGHYQVEDKYAWSRKSKKYRRDYFAALDQLWGGVHDKDCQEEKSTARKDRADQVCDMANEAGV